MPTSAHPPLEEYLEAIGFLIEEGVVVVQARVAERLGHSPQAVSETISRLEADGYVRRIDRQIQFTELGESIATTMIRRHRLAECVLVDIIGVVWASAHHEAGRWEHVISEQVEERLVAILGDPATDPYGNPIPGSRHTAPKRAELSALNKVDVGHTVRLERIPESIEEEYKLLQLLEETGFVTGAVAPITRQLMGATSLCVKGQEVTYGNVLSQNLLVTVLAI